MRRFRFFNKITSIVAILALFGAAGCTDESFPIPQEKTPLVYEGEKITKYFSFSLDMVDGTPSSRAEDTFEDGAGFESNISNVFILFFNADGQYLTYFDSDDLYKLGVDDINFEELGWRTTVTVPVKIYESIQDETFDSFFAVVNYSPEILADLKKIISKYENEVNEDTDRDAIKENEDTDQDAIKNIISKTRKNKFNDQNDEYFYPFETKIHEYRRFIMSSPGHYEDTDYTFFQKIPAGNKVLYDFGETPVPVKVYVERLAARIEIEFDTSKIQPIEVVYGTSLVYLNFIPDKWGLEAQENSQYVAKHIPNTSDISEENGYRSGFFNWMADEDLKKFRIFWAESPSFSASTYPSRGDESKNNLTLDYNSFSEIGWEFRPSTSNSKIFTGCDYTSEHTFDYTELLKEDGSADNPYAVPTSLVVTGKYKGVFYGTDRVPENMYPVAGEIDWHCGGFYIRDVDIERQGKVLKYRLYREKGEYILDEHGNKVVDKESESTKDKYLRENELYTAFLKEQHMIFVKSEEIHSYEKEKKDEDGNIIGTEKVWEITTTFVPLKEKTVVYEVLDKKYEDYYEEENGKQVRKQKLVGGKTSDPIELNAADYFDIVNTNKRWLNNDKYVKASNTWTLQIKDGAEILPPVLNEFEQGKDKEEEHCYFYYGVYPATNEEGNIPSDYPYDPAEYAPIKTNEDADDANKALQKQLGFARKYHQAKAFFYTPITHYTGSDRPFNNTNKFTGLFNYGTNGKPDHNTGDFGIVRNHVYHFNINGISSLGYGIPDLDYIPLPELIPGKERYYFDLELKILPWNRFEYTLDIY